MKNEKGFTLIEVLIAMAILGIVATGFLMALSTASKAIILADERTTAESLARSQMEDIKKQTYDETDPYDYEQAGVESSTHPGYFISVDADPLNNPDDGIQKIIVKIYHGEVVIGEEVITLEGYKVDR